MKKIVSLVLALVLVLAIAAPAMAITGYVTPITPATASAPFGGGLTLVDAASSGLGILGLNAVATNRAYVANEVIYGRVDITGNPKTTWNGYDYWATTLVISSNAAVLVNGYAYQIKANTSSYPLLGYVGGEVKEAGKATLDSVNNTLTWVVPAVEDYVVLFSGVVKAQGTIVAELKGGNMEYFKGIKGELSETAYPIYDDLGTLLYTMCLSGNDVIVDVYKAGSVIGGVKFVRSGKVCTDIQVWTPATANDGYISVKYTVPISNEGAVLESIGNYNATNSYHTFNALKAVYEQVMTFFGFDYNAKGELLDAHFTSKLHSFYAKDEVTVNLYTQAITVPDPDVEIPQTGDAATTIGFVMVAMAIVAAAAVAYKKVRA